MYWSKNILLSCTAAVLLCAVVPMVAVASPDHPDAESTGSEAAFMKVISVVSPSVIVPTVVEVPLPEQVWRGEQFLIKEQATGRYIGGYLRSETVGETPVHITSEPSSGGVNRLNDNDLTTYTDFALPPEGQGEVTLVITAPTPITTSQLRVR